MRSQATTFRAVPRPRFLTVIRNFTRWEGLTRRRFAVLSITKRPSGPSLRTFVTVHVTTPPGVLGVVTVKGPPR